MADDNQNQNNQNQGKNKGGGGGGGGPGISLSAKFDTSTINNTNDLKKQMVGQAANGIAMLAAIAVGGIAFMFMKDTFGITDGPAQSGGGGGGQVNPGQLTGAMFQLKKSDPDKFAEIMGKLNPPA